MPNEDAFKNCDFSSATELSSSSPYEYTIDAENTYFACEISGHCGAGQKLHASVDGKKKQFFYIFYYLEKNYKFW